MTKVRKPLILLALVGLGGVAVAAAVASDAEIARALDRDGAPIGWNVRLLPPDPIEPADKPTMDLRITTDTRTDLDQQVILRHHEGENIHPCIRVFHHFNANGAMKETVNFLDGDDDVHITVPDGYRIVQKPNGSYTVAAIPVDTVP